MKTQAINYNIKKGMAAFEKKHALINNRISIDNNVNSKTKNLIEENKTSLARYASKKGVNLEFTPQKDSLERTNINVTKESYKIKKKNLELQENKIGTIQFDNMGEKNIILQIRQSIKNLVDKKHK